jgi:hypothetical protein
VEELRGEEDARRETLPDAPLFWRVLRTPPMLPGCRRARCELPRWELRRAVLRLDDLRLDDLRLGDLRPDALRPDDRLPPLDCAMSALLGGLRTNLN